MSDVSSVRACGVKLHGLARVKNEGDVIEEFVRHNLRFLDALTVVDHMSFDGTVRVLEALQAEGLALTVLHDPVLPKRQYETMTRIARASAAEADWDFLFLLDADEFVKADGRAGLERALAVLEPSQNGLLPWCSYVPTVHDNVHEQRVLNRITYRRAVEATPAYSKAVLSRRFAEGVAFTISEGNHAVQVDGAEVPAVAMHDVALAHYPVRSVSQIQAKALVGWGAYLAMGIGAERYGWHQRRLFHRLESAAAWGMDELYEIGLHYTEEDARGGVFDVTRDPMEPVSPWRYGNAAITNPMQLAAGYVRQLAAAIAESDPSARTPRSAATERSLRTDRRTASRG